MQLVPAGAELAVRRALWVILFSSNVVNIFWFFFHMPANSPLYLSFSAAQPTQSATLRTPTHLVSPKLAMEINLTKQGNAVAPERQIYVFRGLRHSFLAAGELFGCENMKITGAGIHLKGEKIICIFFFSSGCSNTERAKY